MDAIRTQDVRGRLTAAVDGRIDRSTLLLLPLVVFEVAVFVVPLLLLVRYSLFEQAPTAAYVEGTWTFASFTEIATSSYLHGIIWFTVKLAVLSTVLTVVVSMGYAYAIWRATGLLKSVMLLAVVLPLFVTLVVKIYAWALLLSPNGTINDVLLTAGAVADPLALLYTFESVLLGQVYVCFPYAVLAIYSVLATLDWTHVEAARDLGASRPRSVYEVVLPQAVPGIVVATVISFAWGMGAFAAPSLLGKGQHRTVAIEVYDLVLTEFNWPAAGALSLFMLVVVVAAIYVQFAVLGADSTEVTDG